MSIEALVRQEQQVVVALCGRYAHSGGLWFKEELVVRIGEAMSTHLAIMDEVIYRALSRCGGELSALALLSMKEHRLIKELLGRLEPVLADQAQDSARESALDNLIRTLRERFEALVSGPEAAMLIELALPAHAERRQGFEQDFQAARRSAQVQGNPRGLALRHSVNEGRKLKAQPAGFAALITGRED